MWVLSSVGCGGGAATAGPATPGAKLDATAARFSAQGLSVARPDGWQLAAADKSVGKDVVVVLIGPTVDQRLAATVEIARRPLSAMDKRRPPAELVGMVTQEAIQTFEGSDAVAAPAEAMVAGLKGVVVQVKYDEPLADGTEVPRVAKIYAVVAGDNLWMVRCVLPSGGAFESDLNSILASIAFEST
ncbi:MAG: hypothetical protein HY903_03625 [Deltaproteobacteria bacterium]|nr:hypothetical protein [Deltaproteobacteria bacterium]